MRTILIALALTLTALPAAAQTITPQPLPPQAQEAVDKGVLAAKQQDFLLAIRYFQDARKLAAKASEIYYDLGLAESKIPGRELRAIAWFGAFLAVSPNASNAAAVKGEIDRLDVKSQSNLSHMIRTAQDAAIKFGYPGPELRQVSHLWAEAGDFPDAFHVIDLIPDTDRDSKSRAQADIARMQAKWGDIAGAQITANLIQDPYQKGAALIEIAKAKRKVGDIAEVRLTLASALRVADLVSEPSRSEALQAITEAQADIGDFASALKSSDMIQLTYLKATAQVRIASDQLRAADIAGAQNTLALPAIQAHTDDDALRDYIDQEQLFIARTQAWAGDIRGAQKTVNLIRDGSHWNEDKKSTAQQAIAVAQAKAGDIAGALKTAGLIQENDRRGWGLTFVAEVQAKAGDIAGAQRTIDLIQDSEVKSRAQRTIAEVQAKASSTNNAAAAVSPATKALAPVQPIVSVPVQPAIPAIKVSDWLEKLDEGSTSYDCALNTGPFLDLATYLKSLPPSDDPQKVFQALHDTADRIVKAQNVIDKMLKQQSGK